MNMIESDCECVHPYTVYSESLCLRLYGSTSVSVSMLLCDFVYSSKCGHQHRYLFPNEVLYSEGCLSNNSIHLI